MELTFRYLSPAVLILFSLFLLPEIPAGFRLANHEDVPGVYISLSMLSLLAPTGLLTMFKPRFGGPVLAAIGALGVTGQLLPQYENHSPFQIGFVGVMFVLALVTGVISIFLRES